MRCVFIETNNVDEQNYTKESNNKGHTFSTFK
jgi:hypothetical protein